MTMKRPRTTAGVPLKEWSCTHCQEGNCNGCTDILRAVYEMDPVCKCKRPGHSGEPKRNQILDPADGTVYAPGLTVSSDGEVKRGVQPVSQAD